jgi:hypothetical protein
MTTWETPRLVVLTPAPDANNGNGLITDGPTNHYNS